MPLIWVDKGNEWCVFMAAIPWCLTETVRFTYYQFKSLQPYLGHLRYNLFIVLYPVGVGGELICCYKTWYAIKDLHEKPFSVSMPNALNVGFAFDQFLLFVVPLMYGIFFPQLYMHMVRQRSRFYGKLKSA